MALIKNTVAILFVISSIDTVLGKREPLHRFIVEEGVKPALFGSYSYDPLRQVFEPPPPEHNDTVPSQIYNNTHVLSTVIGKDEQKTNGSTAKNTSMFFRKHVTPMTHKTTAWWARPKISVNATKKHHII